MQVERLFGIGHMDETAWRALESSDFPFLDLEFLRALENSGSVGASSGWSPVYLVCKDDLGGVLGAL